MFETSIGPVKDAGSTVYLRPETAQGIFLDFKTTLQYARKKPPFGIAQIGKSFRNEITPGNFIFRTLEFEQMEMEFFVPPDEAAKWHEYWMQQRMDWYVSLGLDRDALRLREHGADELSHYSSATSDIEYLYPIGWSELEGIANRGDFDLRSTPSTPGRSSSSRMLRRRGYVPHVIEPAAGVGPHRARPPLRRLRRGRHRRRAAHRAPARAAHGADQGGRAAAREQGRPAGEGARHLRGPARAGSRPSTTPAARSASATAARTRSARPGA